MINGLPSSTSQIKDATAGLTNSASNIKDTASGAISQLKGAVSGAADKISDLVSYKPHYKKPAASTETLLLDDVVQAAKSSAAKAGNMLVDACESMYDNVVGQITDMLNTAKNAAVGAVESVQDLANAAIDGVENAYNTGKASFNNAIADVEEMFELEDDATANGDMQGTLYENAFNKIQNLTPKELKTLAEVPGASDNMASELAGSGISKLTGK